MSSSPAAPAPRTRLIPAILIVGTAGWAVLCVVLPGPIRVHFGSAVSPLPATVPTVVIAFAITLLALLTVWSFRSGHATKSRSERRGDLAALLCAMYLFGAGLVVVGAPLTADPNRAWIALIAAILAASVGYFLTHAVLRRARD